MKMTAALMLKAPRPGEVKTRLGREIGWEKATAVYRFLAERQVAAVPEGWGCAVHFAPAEAMEEMRVWLGQVAPAGTVYRPQREGDLGERMVAAVRMELAAGAEGVVLLGGDCPEVDEGVLREVEHALRGHDVVIGAARDGGYVLLALKGDHPGIFTGIPWSTGEVLRETLAAVEGSGLSAQVLGLFGDVDVAADIPLALWSEMNLGN